MEYKSCFCNSLLDTVIDSSVAPLGTYLRNQPELDLVSMPPRRKRASDMERIAQFSQCVVEGKIVPGRIYTAKELSDMLGWHFSVTTRLIPEILAAQSIPGKFEWDVQESGENKRYYFQLKPPQDSSVKEL